MSLYIRYRPLSWSILLVGLALTLWGTIYICSGDNAGALLLTGGAIDILCAVDMLTYRWGKP